MKIYSRDIHEQGFVNKYGKNIIRKVCAPCFAHPCIPLEVDHEHASRCKTQFIGGNAKVKGLCECFAHHSHGYDQPKVVKKSYPPQLGISI